MSLVGWVRGLLRADQFPHLRRSIIELNSYRELQKVFKWTEAPILDRPDIYDFDYVEDVNERRIRDAESVATVMRNAHPSVALEIGTSTGLATALMATNAPDANIFTVNIPAEEIATGQGGELTTIALEKEEIGKVFRARNVENITQIYANTAKWEPDIGIIDIALIDGSHDTEFVVNDTRKVLRHSKPGSFILWHDFNLELVDKFGWIRSVCLGVEKLYVQGLLTGRLFHIRDSWVGIYRV